VLTLAEAKSVLGRGGGDKTEDEAIQRAVDALTGAFDAHFGTVLHATVTAEEHEGNRRRIRVRRAPVSSWTTVTEYESTTSRVLTRQTLGTAPASGYVAEAASPGLFTGWLTRTAGGIDYAFARGGVAVTYQAGRFATVADVPDRWKEAATVALVSWWRIHEPSIEQTGEYDVPRLSFPTFAIPKASVEMLRDEWAPPRAFGVA
jgi:hypothetical protein